jgi:hypothetical protein
VIYLFATDQTPPILKDIPHAIELSHEHGIRTCKISGIIVYQGGNRYEQHEEQFVCTGIARSAGGGL